MTSYQVTLLVLACVGLSSSTAFQFWYSLKTKWYRSPMGWNLWLLNLVDLLFFGLTVWSVAIGPKLPWEKGITIGFYALAAGVITFRLLSSIRVQHKAIKELQDHVRK